MEGIRLDEGPVLKTGNAEKHSEFESLTFRQNLTKRSFYMRWHKDGLYRYNGIKCAKCGDEITSNHIHDFKWCSCESVAIDGGDEYVKVTGKSENIINQSYSAYSTYPNLFYISGDATIPLGPGEKCIAHCCNDIGAWGKGFVVPLGKKFPEAKKAYLDLKNTPDLKLGKLNLVQVSSEIFIANMIGQHGIYPKNGKIPLVYSALDNCFMILSSVIKTMYKVHNYVTVHMPRIGCGLAGGEWSKVRELIIHHLCNHNIRVYVYDIPGGEFKFDPERD